MADRQHDGKLRVGIIGVGAMGSHHARVYGELPDAELVAVADSDEARRSEIQRAQPVRAYADYERMLDEEELDAVTVAVPTRLHLEVGMACIERGVPLLIEKPLAAEVEQGLRLRDAAEAGQVPLLAGHIERFNPAVVELARRLEQGEAGRLLQVQAQRVGPFFPRERDVGVVHDLATHDIDVLRHLVGSDVANVQAEIQSGIRTEHEDALSAVLRFDNGVIGTLDVNWLSPVKKRELRVLGERGVFTLDYTSQQLTFSPASIEAPADIDAAEVNAALIAVERREPLRAELESFLRVARREETPRVDATNAIETMRIVDALIESAKRGEPLALPVGGAQ